MYQHENIRLLPYLKSKQAVQVFIGRKFMDFTIIPNKTLNYQR